MPDITPALTAVTAYGDQCHAEGVQQGFDSRAGEIAGLNLQITLLEGQLNALTPTPFGVNIHSTFRHSVYGDDNAVFQRVVECGAAFVRDRLSPDRKHPQRALWARLAEVGVKVHVEVGAVGQQSSPADRAALTQALIDNVACLDSVAGWNEPEGNPKWAAACGEWQTWLYQTVKATPELAHLPVVSPALRDRNKNLRTSWQAMFAAMPGAWDLTNLHLYPFGEPLDAAYLQTRLDQLPPEALAKPIIVTELGWNTGIGVPGGAAVVATDIQVQHTKDALLFLKSRGITGYVYELLDDPDVTVTNYQAHWGLYNCPSLDAQTWAAKPAVAELRKMSGR